MIAVSEIAERLNAQAATLASELLPNGHRAGNKWMASGIDDTGRSASLAVNLTGAAIGHWTDYGNAAPGEERGDMLDLLRIKHHGGDIRSALADAKARLGIEDDFQPGYRPDPAEQARRAAEARARAEQREQSEQADREARARGARALFLKGAPIAGTPAEFYLRERGLEPGPSGEWPGSLRFHGEVYCKAERVKVPALLACIVNPQGKQVGTHRIFLAQNRGRWGKLDTPSPKMVLGNMWGAFIPINKGASGKSMAAMRAGEPVYVTEGPEDAVCVRMIMPEARIVCAISLGNIGAIVLPESAGELVIVADRDSGEKAQATLERAIAQQQARGQAVKLVLPPAQVGGRAIKDVNDWWRALQAPQRGAA